MKRAIGVVFSLALIALAAYRVSLPQSPAAIAAAPSGSLSLITEPDQGMTPILSIIGSASSSVDVVMYEFEDPQIEEALAQDAARGVDVRVLLNEGYYGKKENTDNDAAYRFFQSHNVAVQWTPASFALTHQKTVVIDGKEVLIMTLNFTPQYYATSRDFALADTDSNDAAAIEQTFDDDWDATRTIASDGDDLVWSPGSEQSLIALIGNARTSLDIYNEEMADAPITQALEDAAKRGVAIRIDMTYSSEWKSAFAQLAQAGAQVRTYAAKAPLYIHAKAIIADNTTAFLGSENFSAGSLKNNRELGIIIRDPAVISSLEATFQKDWSGASAFQ